jgi:hypothetical protein
VPAAGGEGRVEGAERRVTLGAPAVGVDLLCVWLVGRVCVCVCVCEVGEGREGEGISH